MTPVCFGRGQTSFGDLWLAWTEKGLCALRLAQGTSSRSLGDALLGLIPDAQLSKDHRKAQKLAAKVNLFLAGKVPSDYFTLDMRGTSFQKRVWQELCRIPRGQTRSYSEVARCIGKPRAVRAVANACAGNPIALIVPCHRVIRHDGGLGGYYWGLARKRQLLLLEGVDWPGNRDHQP